MMNLEVWTIGHSTRSAEEFVALLREHRIEVLADVRLLPGSRRHPHFNAEQLAAFLAQHGIDYMHFAELGGRRKPRKDSPNVAWRHEAFRGYADYMMTVPFAEAVERLSSLAKSRRVAIMCAEALWWQCHRALISDYLKVRGANVWHILAPGKVEEHPYTSAARIVSGQLSYGDLLAAPQVTKGK
jgi:uncharacterized protein (DUF488 family)